jgi:hypothetical protein
VVADRQQESERYPDSSILPSAPSRKCSSRPQLQQPAGVEGGEGAPRLDAINLGSGCQFSGRAAWPFQAKKRSYGDFNVLVVNSWGLDTQVLKNALFSQIAPVRGQMLGKVAWEALTSGHSKNAGVSSHWKHRVKAAFGPARDVWGVYRHLLLQKAFQTARMQGTLVRMLSPAANQATSASVAASKARPHASGYIRSLPWDTSNHLDQHVTSKSCTDLDGLQLCGGHMRPDAAAPVRQPRFGGYHRPSVDTYQAHMEQSLRALVPSGPRDGKGPGLMLHGMQKADDERAESPQSLALPGVCHQGVACTCK